MSDELSIVKYKVSVRFETPESISSSVWTEDTFEDALNSASAWACAAGFDQDKSTSLETNIFLQKSALAYRPKKETE